METLIHEMFPHIGDESELANALEHRGEKYLDRYMYYRTYRAGVADGTIKLPILPIIGAMPCLGKTSIGADLARRLGILQMVGADGLRAVFRELIDKEAHPYFFTSVYGAWKFAGDGTETEENVAKGFRLQANVMNDLMQRWVADRGIRDGESAILEFLHLLPTRFLPEILEHPSVIPIVLRIDDMDLYKNRIASRVTSTHLKGGANRLIEVADKYLQMQEIQCADAEKAGIPVILVDDWNSAMDQILTIVFEAIGKINELKDVETDSRLLDRIKAERSLNPGEGK